MDHEANGDSIAAFVDDLRQLWIDDGRRPFAALARRTDVGKSTLNEAVTRHDRLPTERTVTALVEVLDGENLDHWLGRRERLLAPPASPAQPRTPPMTVRAAPPRRGAVALAVILVATAGSSFWMGRTTAPGAATTATEQPREVTDGTDPIEAGCVPDAGTVASSTKDGIGTMRLIYSTTCDAFWAKIDRHDGLSIGNRLEIAVFERGTDDREQRAVEPDVTSAYTFVLRRENAFSVHCARGAVWVDTTRHELPDAC